MAPEPGKERRSRQWAVSVLLGLVLLWLARFCEVSAGHVVRDGRDRQHGCQLSPRGLLRVGGSVRLVVNCSVSTMSAAEAGKRRTASKGWLKRASKKLGALLSKSDIDYVELSDAAEEFDLRLAAFDVSQTEFEYYWEEDKLEADIEVSAKFREDFRVNRVKATKKLQELSADDRDSDHGGAASRAFSVDVNLPKLSLPVFSGNVIEWQTFWDQFSATVDSTDLPVVSKFTYLRSLLDGEAKQAIEGLSITNDHYKTAWSILKERYGRKKRIIFTHIQELLNISLPSKCSLSMLWLLNDTLQAHMRSLDSLGIKGDQYGVILTPLVLSRLPVEMRLEWARDGEKHESDLPFLMKFINTEIKRRERSQVYSESISTIPMLCEEKRRVLSATALLNSSKALQTKSRSSVTCGICDKSHPTARCWNLTKIQVSDRKEKLRSAGLCFRCLTKGHIAVGCSATCSRCKGKHHLLLCNPSPDTVGKSSPKTSCAKTVNASTSTADGSVSRVTTATCPEFQTSGHKRVILQTARVSVRGTRDVTDATVLFDSGADRSYIRSDLVSKIAPEYVDSEKVSMASFGVKTPSDSKLHNVYKVHLKGNLNTGHSILVTETDVICANLHCSRVPSELMESFGDLVFADDYETSPGQQIDIFIGMDAYWRFVGTQFVESVPKGLMAQSTVFGWVLSGAYSTDTNTDETVVSHQMLCFDGMSERCLQTFWDLESVGISEVKDSVCDPVLAEFQQSIEFVKGRYVVALPWKSELKGKLLNNERVAKARLLHLDRKLDKNASLKERYDQNIYDMWKAGIVEEVPPQEIDVKDKTVFYLPHQPVVKENRLTTKVSPVFDASCKGYNGISLNSCMNIGPNLLTKLTEILIRFRRWKFAITADIEKAFLQIGVKIQDRDVHRFLWNFQGEHKVMRFCRIPFGNCSSPFLLNATVKYHLSTVPQSQVTQELNANLYVDDLLSGSDSHEEACSFIHEASAVMNQASLPLVKWGSNSEVVAELLHQEFHDKYVDDDVIRVLGMKWLANEDCFSFDGIHIPENLLITKRVILISRLFDPLGFVSPFIMQAKCLFQHLWTLKLQWDDEVPDECVTLFRGWMSDLQLLQHWRIPRNYTRQRWNDISLIELHGFGDASPKGYGACVYIKAKLMDGSTVTSLVVAKSKVAPLKKVTLPRLEVLGAVLCARLTVFVRETLRLPIEVECTCWSDSMLVLAWIKSDPNRWKEFVANRVTTIQSLVPSNRWSHCPGEQNPADLLTRGVSASELMNSKQWLHGPQFMTSGLTPSSTVLVTGSDNIREELASVMLVPSSVNPEVTFDVERRGSFSKAIRVVAWVYRFLGNLKHDSVKQSGELTFNELQLGKLKLIQKVQKFKFALEFDALGKGCAVHKGSSIAKLSPFIDSEGLHRVLGRLQYSELSYEERHPIILPKCHLSVLLVRFHHELLKHAGVATMLTSLRNQFWIMGVRRIAKRVKKMCIDCQRQDAPAGHQPMPPLPDLRVKQAVPFAITGLDHAGPLYCCDFPGKKFSILLFTCAVIRAIHIELVESVSASETMLALRRLAARRGLPRVLFSDNAKGFRAAPSLSREQYGHLSPEWRFIAPRSPWWGGWWERLIKSVKSALKRTLGTNSLTRVELETTVHEIEACINSRPLTFLGDDINSEDPITPAHFLLGRSAGYFSGSPLNVMPDSSQHLAVRLQFRKLLMDKFWSIWSTEYLRNLPPCVGPQGKGHPIVGSVVLVEDETSNRLRWPLGIVTRLFPGTDGVIRTLEVKVGSSVLIRPVQRIHDLELVHCSSSDVSVPSSTPEMTETGGTLLWILQLQVVWPLIHLGVPWSRNPLVCQWLNVHLVIRGVPFH